MLRRTARALAVLGLLVAISAFGIAQQPNSPTASLVVNGVVPVGGPASVIADNCSGLDLSISSGSNASQPFALFAGPLAPGFWVNDPTIGSFDLDYTQPSFAVLADGISFIAGDPVLNAISITDLGGNWQLFAGIPFGAPSGPFGALQATVADPGAPQGFLLTAASDVTILSGVVGGTLAIAEDTVVTQAFQTGFLFTYYGTQYSAVNITDNGVVGFGNVADLNAMNTLGGVPAQVVTNSSSFLGTGNAAPPVIGFFEGLTTLAGGGQGSVIWTESPTQFSVTWCDCQVTGTGGISSLTVTLQGDASANPGRIEITVNNASVPTLMNGRLLGISPGGNGTTSNSPTQTGINLSSQARNFGPGAVNAGFTAAAAMDAIYESFNFAWGLDPINPTCDLVGETVRFEPATPGTGPYSAFIDSEAPLTIGTVTPNSSPLAGGGMMTIQGSGFRNDGSMTADLGGSALTALTYVDAETLTGTIPAVGAPTTVNVNVMVGSTATSISLMNGFSYSFGPINGSLALTDEEVATYQFSPSLFASMTMYGQVFTEIHVQANGHAFFSSSAPTPGAADFTSNPANWNAFPEITLAPMFNDLCTSGAPGCSSTGPTSSVTTTETGTQVVITWNDWVQWPNLNPSLTFSLILDKTNSPNDGIIFDYGQSPVSPNLAWSQPGGQTGIIVGMTPGTSNGAVGTAPLDFATVGAGGQGANANMFHWLPSATTTSTVPASGTGTWIFGDSSVMPGMGTTSINFLSNSPGVNNDWVILLL